MSILEQEVSMPLSDLHQSNTCSNNVSSNRRGFSVSSPTPRAIYITNLLYLQIINTSNQGSHLSDCYWNQQTIILTSPNNPGFPLETINWRKSCQTGHHNTPPKCCCCRALVQSLQIPNILRSSCLHRRLIRSGHGPHK
jgi:hypothetical protein